MCKKNMNTFKYKLFLVLRYIYDTILENQHCLASVVISFIFSTNLVPSAALVAYPKILHFILLHCGFAQIIGSSLIYS